MIICSPECLTCTCNTYRLGLNTCTLIFLISLGGISTDLMSNLNISNYKMLNIVLAIYYYIVFFREVKNYCIKFV